MKKKLLGALLTFCLMLALLPTATFAAAASSVQIGMVMLDRSTPYWRNGEDNASSSPTGYNAYYNADTGLLILRDADITTSYDMPFDNNTYGIYAAGDLELFLEGSNQVGGASLDAAYGNSCGVYAYSMSISGNGSLVATGGNAAGESDKSCGIYVDTYLLIGGGTVKASSISTIGVAQAMNVQPSYWNGYAFGGYLVKAGADESSAAVIDNPVYGTYTGSKYVNIMPALRASTPSATFSFDGPNEGKLMGTTAQMKYSLDGGNNWVACAAPSTDLFGVLGSISQVNDVQVKDMGDGISTVQSLVQNIDITQAPTPTAVGKVDCSTLANNDGKLTGVTTTMEYKLSTAGTWTSGTGSDITGLANGTYLVRVKATGTVLASDAQTVVINAYVGTPAVTPSATFSFDGANAGKLMGTTARMKYSLDGGSLWLACAAPSTDLSGVLGAIGQTMDLRVRDMGDGVSTTGSAVQTIDITKASTPMASKVDCSTLANNDGKLTGVTTAMEYKLFTAGVWTSGTGSDIAGLANGTYLVRVKATGMVLASDLQTLVINAYVGTPATTPSATFSFDGANAGKLMGTTARMKYSLDGGSLWIGCAAPSTDLSGVLGTIGQTMDLRVKDMGDGVNTTESQVQTIDITQAVAPTTAGKADCSTLANNDGKLTGVTTAMEYWSYTDGTWVSGTGSDITGLQSRTYYVRVKATGTVLASNPQLVTINAYVGTPATTPSAIFSFDGSDSGKLLGTTEQMRYSLDGGSTWVACTAPNTSLSDAAGSINEDDDIKVKDMGDGVTTTESAVQIIDITRAARPTLVATQPSTIGDNGSIPLTTEHEYRLSGAIDWISADGTTSLAPGNYLVRVKATGTVLASDPQTLVINAYVGTPATTPSAIFSFDGSDAGKLLGTTTQMVCSLDGGDNWARCSAPSTNLSGAMGSIRTHHDIKVKDLGDGVTTTESAVQTIDITQAGTPAPGKVDCTTLANNDGKLTGVTTAMEYKLSTAGAWTSGTGSDITGLANGIYQVRVKATGTVLASDAQDVVISAYVGNPATTPNATFSFDGVNAGKLLGTTTQTQYSLDGGGTWLACTEPSTDLSDAVGSISVVNDIKVKDMGDGLSTIESLVQTIVITQAARPTLVAIQPGTIGGNGSIPLTTDHEYRLSDAINWISANGAASLAPGNYLVRVRATGTVLASETQSITLTAFTGNPESTPAAFVDYAAEKLTNLTAEGSYALNGTDVSADGEGMLAIDNDWFGTTIALVKKGDGVTTNDSEAQSLVLAARPAAPVCAATQPSASAATGTVSGITAEMQYSIDNGTSWTDGTGSAVTGLVPGTVLVRVKATGSAPASRNQTLTITAYSAPPVDEESGGSSGNSGNPVPAPVTEISSGGSTTRSNLSQLVSTSKTLTVAGDDGAKLVFDTDALKGIADQTADGISVELREVSSEHQDNHPGKRVFTLTVSSGGKTISEFGGSVTVTLPYALQDGEEPEDVTVWYLADDGTMTEISCAYDPLTGLATFQVSHFSRYVVGAILEETVPEEVHFSDVQEGDWFHGVVRYVAQKGLIGATSGAAFSPQSNTTRSLLISILWRLEHEPEATSAAAFSDVLPGESYAEAVAWGAENALVGGYSASRFGPDDSITREQLAVFLYRYAKYKGADVSARGDLSVFRDKPSAYARTSVQWAVAKGLLRGNGSSDFLDPTGGATRAQLAAILQRFIENVLK